MTADRKTSLRDIFNAEAQRAVDSFTCLQRGLIIVDAAHAQASYAEKSLFPDIAPSEQRAKDIDFITKFTAGEKHSFCNISWGYHLIVMADHVTLERAMFGLPQHQELLFTLDHEIGHLVVPGGFHGGRSFTKEACADIYALLRAEQRWGDMAPMLRANRFKRAFDTVFKARTTHYTLPATAALATLRTDLDIKSMAPDELTTLANRLMTENTPDGIALAEMTLALTSVKNVYDDNDDNIEDAARLLARMAQSGTLPPLAQTTARLVLGELLSGDMLVHGKPVKLDGSRWQQVSEWLARSETAPATTPSPPRR